MSKKIVIDPDTNLSGQSPIPTQSFVKIKTEKVIVEGDPIGFNVMSANPAYNYVKINGKSVCVDGDNLVTATGFVTIAPKTSS